MHVTDIVSLEMSQWLCNPASTRFAVIIIFRKLLDALRWGYVATDITSAPLTPVPPILPTGWDDVCLLCRQVVG